MGRKAPNPREEQHRCDVWNRTNKIGSPVPVALDLGRTLDTATRSEAVLLGGHTAVVWLEDVSGAYALDKVRAL
jgi:hypothetical protein